MLEPEMALGGLIQPEQHRIHCANLRQPQAKLWQRNSRLFTILYIVNSKLVFQLKIVIKLMLYMAKIYIL